MLVFCITFPFSHSLYIQKRTEAFTNSSFRSSLLYLFNSSLIFPPEKHYSCLTEMIISLFPSSFSNQASYHCPFLGSHFVCFPLFQSGKQRDAKPLEIFPSVSVFGGTQGSLRDSRPTTTRTLKRRRGKGFI